MHDIKTWVLLQLLTEESEISVGEGWDLAKWLHKQLKKNQRSEAVLDIDLYQNNIYEQFIFLGGYTSRSFLLIIFMNNLFLCEVIRTDHFFGVYIFTL